jgi:hypothetical protein
MKKKDQGNRVIDRVRIENVSRKARNNALSPKGINKIAGGKQTRVCAAPGSIQK